MWDTPIRVEREQAVDAAPEKVWALAGDVAALSAMPGRSAFGVPAKAAGVGRLCCLLVPGKVLTCAVLDVREEIPGQMICWQTRSTQSVGRQVFTMSVRPHQRGSVVRIAVSSVVPRTWRVHAEADWRKLADTWVARLGAIVEGREPWPALAMPAAMQSACASQPPLKKPERFRPESWSTRPPTGCGSSCMRRSSHGS
ncbi:MAG TPA: SRPBCC family protein [Streptosporangiaceae bacterium]|jgi:hypothetical protein